MADTKQATKKQTKKKLTTQFKEDNERGARENVIEELFYDFNRSKSQIYWVNFQRGIFFGIGSVLGGALIVAVSVFIFSIFVNLPLGIGQFIQSILDAMQNQQQ